METKYNPPAEEVTVPVYLHEVLGRLAENKRLADVVFLVGEKKMFAHRLLLAAHSPIFECMLYNEDELNRKPGTTHQSTIEVKINDCDPLIFEAMLQCIYQDSVQITSDNLEGLMKLSSRYQIDKLRVLCAEFMEGDINMDNVFDLFKLGPTLLGDDEFGLKFIEEHATELFASENFLKLPKDRLKVLLRDDKLSIDEIEVFKAVQRWAKAEQKKSQGEGTDLKSIVKELIPLIRFPMMEMTEVATFVAPSGLLESGQIVGLFSYLSVTDEAIRSKLPTPAFPTTPREGKLSSFPFIHSGRIVVESPTKVRCVENTMPGCNVRGPLLKENTIIEWQVNFNAGNMWCCWAGLLIEGKHDLNSAWTCSCGPTNHGYGIGYTNSALYTLVDGQRSQTLSSKDLQNRPFQFRLKLNLKVNILQVSCDLESDLVVSIALPKPNRWYPGFQVYPVGRTAELTFKKMIKG